MTKNALTKYKNFLNYDEDYDYDYTSKIKSNKSKYSDNDTILEQKRNNQKKFTRTTYYDTIDD